MMNDITYGMQNFEWYNWIMSSGYVIFVYYIFVQIDWLYEKKKILVEWIVIKA